MSLIYTKLTSIVNKISQLFHESLLFTIIFSILNYFENAGVNSYLKGLYPGENFLGFIKKNKSDLQKISWKCAEKQLYSKGEKGAGTHVLLCKAGI